VNEITIIYWRDIPTQIVLGKGRKAIKHQLPDRFMVAVDKAAMKDGAIDSDAYLAGWRKVRHLNKAADGRDELARLGTELENNYPTSRLALLVLEGGIELKQAE